MHGAARLFFILAIVYAVLGMMVGLHMAMSHDHAQMPTHAHIMVAGWVMSAIFAYFYHLFPEIGKTTLAKAHFWLQAVSGLVLVGSLYVLLSGNEGVEPITGMASIGFFAGFLLFSWIALPALRRA